MIEVVIAIMVFCCFLLLKITSTDIRAFLVSMYEGQTTQKLAKNISHMIHPSSCHIIYRRVQTIA